MEGKSQTNPAYMNSTVLAYLGDAVYETYVRKHVLTLGQVSADRLHQSAVVFVRAEAQAQALKSFFHLLSEEEVTVVKRARNKKISSKPKHVDPVIYKWATAFEALVGYLHLAGNQERLEELVGKTLQIIGENKGTRYQRNGDMLSVEEKKV